MIEKLKQLQSFDIVKHDVVLKNKSIFMIFLSSLTSSQSIASIIEGFLLSESQDPLCFFNGSTTEISKYEDAVFLLLSGQCITVIDNQVFALETRSYPSRGIDSPNI